MQLLRKMPDNRVFITEGSYENIKITTPEDLIIGEKILESRMDGISHKRG